MKSVLEEWSLGEASRILKKLKGEMQNRDVREAKAILPKEELLREIWTVSGSLLLQYSSYRNSLAREKEIEERARFNNERIESAVILGS